MRAVTRLLTILTLKSVALCVALPSLAFAATIDWQKITRLEDQVFLAYVETLGLQGQAAIDFWKKIPLSQANRQVLAALGEHPELDVIFCTGAEQAMGAVAAVDQANRWNSREEGRRIIILSNDDLHEALVTMQQDKVAVTVPYTPLLGGLGLRVLIKSMLGEDVPRDITTPDLPMITRHSPTIFGIETVSIEEWMPYSDGRK